MLKLTGRAGEAEAMSMNWMYQGGAKSKEEVEEDVEEQVEEEVREDR